MITSAWGSGSARKSPDPTDAVAEPGGGDRLLGDGGHRGQVVAGATQVGVAAGQDHGELTGGAADVTDRRVPREVDLLGEGVEVARGDARHGAHELLEARRVAVELLEHPGTRALDLVLRLACLQRFGQVAPERIEPGVGHLEEATDVGRALLVQERRRLRRVAIPSVVAVAVAPEEPERHECVEEVVDAAPVQAKASAELFTAHGLVTELGEQVELDRGEERLGGKEAHPYLHRGPRVERLWRGYVRLGGGGAGGGHGFGLSGRCSGRHVDTDATLRSAPGANYAVLDLLNVQFWTFAADCPELCGRPRRLAVP